jgi:hypothetical protein
MMLISHRSGHQHLGWPNDARMNRQRTSIVWKDCDAINNTEGLMSGRYSTYSKLKIDYPHQRVLRITFDRPETYNSVDAETHTELTHIWRDINEDSDIGASAWRCRRRR